VPAGRTAFAALPPAPIRTEGFDGPLELLLHLLDAGDLEITAIALAAVTDQFLAFVRLLPEDTPRLDFLAEFLVVGAQLLVMKSRALLPREAEPVASDGELDEATLEARLAEYRRFREAAARLAERQDRGERAFPRQAHPPSPPPAPPPQLDAAEPVHLARALQRLLALRTRRPEPPVVPRVSLAERIVEVLAAVARRERVTFGWLAAGCLTRADLIITFLAVLELYRKRQIALEQDDLFGEIWVASKRDGAPASGSLDRAPVAAGPAAEA
jgi:segregation and condensation protein A